MTYKENDFTNNIDVFTAFRTPAMFQEKSFELLATPLPQGDYYKLDEIRNICSDASFIDHAVIPDGLLQKRIINCRVHNFWETMVSIYYLLELSNQNCFLTEHLMQRLMNCN